MSSPQTANVLSEKRELQRSTGQCAVLARGGDYKKPYGGDGMQ